MEKVFTNIEHVAWLREQARLKRPYWYGTYFLDCTENLLKKKANQYPNHYGESRMPTYRKHIADGQICGDCVNGAIKGAIWSELGKRKPVGRRCLTRFFSVPCVYYVGKLGRYTAPRNVH